MSSSGALTAFGDISLLPTLPVNTYQVKIDNALGAACLAFPFTLDWARLPAPLAPVGGVGTNMNLKVFVFEPLIAPNVGDTFPIIVPANSGLTLPITLTLYGNITPNFPQTADDYISPAFRVGLAMGTTLKRGPNATATATSITPLTLFEAVPMDFGTVVGSTTSSTVILSTASARTATGGAQSLTAGPGSAATFQLTGGAGFTYIVSFLPGILENAGGQQITVTTFTSNSLGTLPAGGIENFQVGATLNMNASQPAGSYSTATGGGIPYTVTVNYN
jgi:hypothetical protein